MIFPKHALFALLLAPSPVVLAQKKEGEKVQNLKGRSATRSLALGQEVTFPSPCVSLPAGRVPDLGINPANGGWTLVDFCLEGATGSGPAGGDCHKNDDDSSSEILVFTFDLYGQSYTKTFINNNGNLSFEQLFAQFTSTGFPVGGFPMVAPFWADVDTRAAGGGYVWRQAIGSNKFAVAWDNVGYFSVQADKLNTFQVVISDGTDPSMGLGNNVCFCYTDMQWTTGGASGGIAGFGGTPATVGANRGDGVDFFQIGRFDRNGTTYDGAFGNNDGVDYLDQQAICFNAGGENIPPVATNVPPGNRLDLACDETIDNLNIIFLAPENGQTVTLTSSGASAGLTVATSQQPNQATATINWTPTVAAQVDITLTASDGIDQTVVPITFTYPGPCCQAPSVEIWNPDTDALVGPLVNGATVCLGKYNLRVVLCEDAPLVDMKLYDKGPGGVTQHRQKEYVAPYFLWGDKDGDVYKNGKALADGLYGFRFTANSVTTEISFTQDCP